MNQVGLKLTVLSKMGIHQRGHLSIWDISNGAPKKKKMCSSLPSRIALEKTYNQANFQPWGAMGVEWILQMSIILQNR